MKETENNSEREKKGKKKNIYNKLVIIVSILSFVAFAFLTYSIFLVSGIETEIRIIAIAIILLINILIVFLLRKILKKGKRIRYILYILITLILAVGQTYLGYFIFKTYSSIDNINKDQITYSTSLLVLKDSSIKELNDLNDKEIGITVDKTSIDNYVLGLKIIEDNKLNNKNTIIEYDDVSSLIKDLYDKKVDAVVISSNYPAMFRTMEQYKNIENDVVVITKIEKTYKKDEIANITGNESINLNNSQSVTEPFTLLVMGVDSTAETLNSGSTGNGDALMLVTFNPKTLNATILSIPRDSYVYIPCLGFQNKITHAAWGGESCMIKSIEGLTNIPIDYYVKINFKGVVKLVDLLGGITVDVPATFCEQDSNRLWGNNEVCLTEGVSTLNGEQALALARNRYAFATGDFQRGLNQQLVVQGILNQLKTVRSANQALNILDSVSKSMDTNFTTKQLLSFYDILKNMLETSTDKSNLINIQQLYLSGSSQMIYDERTGLVLYNYIVNDSSLNQIVKIMKQNLGLSSVSGTKEFDFDIEENYSMSIIGKNNLNATKLFTLVPNLTGDTEAEARAWLTSHGVTNITVEYEESNKTSGTVLKQGYPVSKRVDLIKDTFVLTVAKTAEITDIPVDNTETPEEPTTPTTPEEPTNGEQTIE